MRISNFVTAFAAALLFFALSGTLLAIWTANRSQFISKRINLAHSSYQEHLELKSNTYQLFKQFGDAMLIGDRDKGAREKELIARIRSNFKDIRAVIGEEIELVGDEEVEELEALAKMERIIDGLILKILAVMKDREENGSNVQRTELPTILGEEIDRKFRAMMTDALDEEREEVAEADAAGRSQALLASRLAYGFALLAVLVTLTSLLLYRREVVKPFVLLMGGIERFRFGEFDQKIDIEANNEIGEIATVLNDMASRVRERTLSLTDQNAELERAVQARTNELERLLSEAQKSEANRRQLLADVSHELRTPLTIIQGESDVALRGGDKTPDEYRDALRRSRDAAAHTAQLVNDLLFISRKEAGEARLSLQELDLKLLVFETLQMGHADASISSTVDTAPVAADSVRLRQAILALLNNAQHYGGKKIHVRVDSTPKGYQISIEDDGPGMSDVEKEKAFERFFRGSNASANYDNGSGLGLPIVRSIAEAHGGTARLEDRESGGLVAVIEIPKRPSLKAVS